jgi:hypothetical protein
MADEPLETQVELPRLEILPNSSLSSHSFPSPTNSRSTITTSWPLVVMVIQFMVQSTKRMSLFDEEHEGSWERVSKRSKLLAEGASMGPPMVMDPL